MTPADSPDSATALPLRIFLRPLGTPLTIGMSGLAVASLVQGGFDLGWVPGSEQVDVGLILISVPFVLQLLAAVFAYLARDGAAGACMGLLSTTWLALGAMHIHAGPGTSEAAGLLLAGAAAMLALSALAMGDAKPLPAAVFLLTSLRFALAAIYQLSGGSGWQEAAGIASLSVVAAAAYCLLAFELEGQRRRPVLPTLRRGLGQVAISGDAAQQLEGIENEPGVRRTA